VSIWELVSSAACGADLIHRVEQRLLLLEKRVLHQHVVYALLFAGFEEVEKSDGFVFLVESLFRCGFIHTAFLRVLVAGEYRKYARDKAQ